MVDKFDALLQAVESNAMPWQWEDLKREALAELRALRAERDELKAMVDGLKEKLGASMTAAIASGLGSLVLEEMTKEELIGTYGEQEARIHALRAKNKALAQQFLDADAYVVDLRARCAELERLGNAMHDDEGYPSRFQGSCAAWRRAVRG